jgi:thiol:disulfide interchange protein
VFAALGLGLAIPFLLIAFVPAFRTRLPRPGRWMDRLKRFLAIPMAASAVAAAWLLYRQVGMQQLGRAVGFAVAVVAVLQMIGMLQRRGAQGAWKLGALAVLIAGFSIAVTPPRGTQVAPRVAGAAPWSEAAVARQLTGGHPVFVYFTADWCLSCKVNETTSIDRDEVRDAFRKARVKVLAGDWTNGDPVITRFLESRGRAGVPLYLWYAPGKPVEELPQVLTPGMLISRAYSSPPCKGGAGGGCS